MSTTTEQKLPATIDPEQFGGMIKIPEILSANQLSASNALAATDKRLAAVDTSKFKEGDVTQIEADMAALVKLRAQLATTVEKLEGKRKPFTGFFDRVKSLFTAEEATVKACIDRVKKVQDEWERVKAQRAADLAAKQAAEIKKKQAAIDVRATVKAGIERAYAGAMLLATQKMNATYNGQSIDKLEQYAERLAKAVPDFSKLEFSRRVAVFNNALTELEIQEIEVAVAKELEPIFQADYTAKMTAERDRLVLLTPARVKALRDNAAAEAKRIADEDAQSIADAAAVQTAADERAAAQAEADKLNTVFEVAATAELAPERSRGTVVKKVYRPATHSDWTAILQQYVARDFPALTLADVEKKFGFCLLAANKRLNDGEVLGGVAWEEDYSTRSNGRK